ncbi:DUF3540 domain-containing protein [Variovorax paradoxus]|uniref:DUF3540 domain-containing protein n=1 Tax=Variovorax paradoxus TaxID=34073 RepID=UPI003999CB30
MTTRVSSVTAIRDDSPREAAHASEQGGMVNTIGIVTGVLPGGIYSVQTERRQLLRCARAASCLLRPAVGDTVLVTGPDATRLYLTAVAEQADASASRIDVAGDMTLASERGAVTVESSTHIAMRGEQGLSLDAPQLRINAEDADCRVDRLQYQGQEAVTTVLSIRVIGRVYEAVMDRLVHLSKTAFRMTEDVEHLRAGRIDYEAAETARLHGKNTVVTAKEIVKVDAKQIHMG